MPAPSIKNPRNRNSLIFRGPKGRFVKSSASPAQSPTPLKPALSLQAQLGETKKESGLSRLLKAIGLAK